MLRSLSEDSEPSLTLRLVAALLAQGPMLRSLSERSETKGAEKRLVAILKDNPLGQGAESA